MIPKEISADTLLFQIQLPEWRQEILSANWPGYWLFQFVSSSQKPLVMLIDLDRLAAICTALRQCIDVALDPSKFPRAKTMYQTAVAGAPTILNFDGSISIVSDWSEKPHVSFNYYFGKQRADGIIRQAFYLPDAMTISDRLAGIYNDFPEKNSWSPRQVD